MGMKLGLTTETFGASENQKWLGSAHGTSEADSITLDGALADTDFPGGSIPSGVVLAKVTATGRYAKYNDALSNGREVALGHLFTTVDLKASGRTTGADVTAALFWHGEVVEANLPSGHGLDAAGKVDLKNVRYV